MNRRSASSSRVRLLAESIPASATTTMSARPCRAGELLDDRDDRCGLGLVALEAADLEGEPVPVDQQPDHDLRVDAAFLGVADLAQVVFLLGLEVQRRDVVEHSDTSPAAHGVGEARGGDLVAVPALRRSGPGCGASSSHSPALGPGRSAPGRYRGSRSAPRSGRSPGHETSRRPRRRTPDRHRPQRGRRTTTATRSRPPAAVPPAPARPTIAPAPAGQANSRHPRPGVRPARPWPATARPRGRTRSWPASASSRRARSSRSPSSASVCADPTCATIRRRPVDGLGDLHGRRTRGRPDPPYPRHAPRLGHSISASKQPPAHTIPQVSARHPESHDQVTEVRPIGSFPACTPAARNPTYGYTPPPVSLATVMGPPDCQRLGTTRRAG